MKFLRSRDFKIILLIIILSIPSIFFLLRSGFFLSDDGEWMVVRFSAFHQAFRDGELPVRWLLRLNHEYGYPVSNFLYPGFMYIAEPIHLLGAGFVDTIKIVFGLSMVGSPIFAYLWLSKLFGRWASIVGAFFYLYTPYHLFDLYKRGSLGEVLALSVVPFILWQIERKSFFWMSMGIAGLILSHNTLALLFLPIIIVYGLMRKVSSIKYQVLSMLSGLAISAFFWIPALFDLQYTRFSQTTVSNWQDHFATFDLIGFSTIIIIAVTSVLLYFDYSNKQSLPSAKAERNQRRDIFKITLLFLIITIVGIFLSTLISALLWRILPVAFVQFPFRFLSLTIVSVAFLSCYVTDQLKKHSRKIIPIILLVVLGFSAMPYSKPERFFDKGDSYYATNEDTTNVQNEYMPKWVKAAPRERPLRKVEMVEEVGKIDNVIARNNKITFTVDMVSAGIARANVVYFPGWEAFIDGTKSEIHYENDKGVMDISIPKGTHVIAFRFAETPIRLASDGASLVSLLSICAIAFWQRYRKEA